MPATGSRAEIVLEMLPLGARFVGPPNLLDRLETTAILRRHRTRPSGGEIPLSVHHVEEEPPEEDTTEQTAAAHTAGVDPSADRRP